MRSGRGRAAAGPRMAAALCAAALSVLTACSSGGAPAGPAAPEPGAAPPLPAEATARLDAALAPVPSFPGPDAPISPAPGTLVTVITCSATGETCVRVATGIQQAGEILGWTVTVVDGKGTPPAWNAAMSAAVASRTQGIVLAGVPPQLVSGGLADAKAAGIPVVYALGLDAQGATALVAPDRAESGRVLADYVARDSGGAGQVVVLRDPEFPELETMAEAFKTELATACPGCKIVSEQRFTLGAMPQQLPRLVQTAMQTNPGTGYVLGPYDATSTFVNQGVRAAGHPAVKIMGTGGDASTTGWLRSGEMTASMGVPAEWMGFQSADVIARSRAGQPVPDVPVVQGLVVQSNLAAVAGNGTYDGGFDYVSAYRKVWGK